MVDKPGPPQGPLEPTEVTAHTISLTWKPPLDNGGAEVTGYVVEKTEANYDMWKVVPGYCPKTNFTVKVSNALNEYRKPDKWDQDRFGISAIVSFFL